MTIEATQIEDVIRTKAETKRIRPSEFFRDYDRLRSGYITETQFFRVLWENLGIQLDDNQQKVLSRKYDLKQDGRLNYRAFCDVINQPFNPDDLQTDPNAQKNVPMEFLGTTRSVRPLSPNSESKIKQLLETLHAYYKYRGINLRSSCEDFDRHHIGVIQESQFYRSFPRPSEVNEEDVHLLVQKYRDPVSPGQINYLNLHHDLEAADVNAAADEEKPTSNSTTAFQPQKTEDQSLQNLFDKISVAVYKNRVRTIEFFKDFDKLRSGVITENQFICGLSLAIGKEAQLTRSEIQQIVEYYRTPDNRVSYKGFCDMMENAFNVPDLEKKPTQEIVRPPAGFLGRNLPCLTDEEEKRLLQVLTEISDQVRKRRLMMYQYFKDFDRSKGYSRVITSTQFGRILHFLSLQVAPKDFKLLCRKFEDSATGDINYPAFVQTVDTEFINYTSNNQSDDSASGEGGASGHNRTDDVKPTDPLSFDELMSRIRHHVLVNRRRVCEYFQDFDPLRSGCVTKSQFRRGLSDLGLSALGQHNLTDAQAQLLCSRYENQSQPDKVFWTRFTADVESVFTQPNLEKSPTHQVPPSEIYHVPKPGTANWSLASDEQRELVESVMQRLSQRASQRRVLAKPVFQDFDKHNHGHVTISQFRQCLTMLELHASDAETAALQARYCDDTGFNYVAFLQHLQPEPEPKLMYVERLREIRAVNSAATGARDPHQQAAMATTPGRTALSAGRTINGHDGDLDSVLCKIKTKVYKERIRVLEWLRDYDKLRSGRMLRSNFRRALDLCTFELTESEISILEDHYQVREYPDHVNYVRFNDDIESLFTVKNLEKAPQVEVRPFKPPVEWEQNQLEPEMEAMLRKCMERLAEKVRKNRIQLFPLFEDYDRVHNGTVSRSQFRRVLSELELAWLVATEQEWLCLNQKYDVRVGGKDDVNYIAFCDELYDLAHFEWRRP